MADDKLPYTERDYDNIRESLIDRISDLTDNWTDYRESDIGITVLDLISMLGDMLSYNIDHYSNEAFLTRAKERDNVRAALRGKGYKMSGYVSAKVGVTMTTTYPEDILIPKYYQLVTDVDPEPIKYAVMEEGVLKSESSIELECMQGEVVKDSFNYEDINEEDMILLSDENIGENTFEVIIDGEEWEEVDDAMFHPDPGRFFSIEYDREERIYLSLHPSWTNYVNNKEEVEIDVVYLLSKGEDGEIGRNSLIEPSEELLHKDEDISDFLEISNKESSFGSSDPETIEHAKRMGVDLSKIMWSAVLPEDFEILARNVDGVSNALALDWKFDDTSNSDVLPPTEPYITDLYIVTDDLSSMPELLEERIRDYLDERRISTTELNIKDAVLYSIDFDIEIRIINNKISELLKELINDELDDFFKPFDREFEEEIKRSDIISKLENTHDDIIEVKLISPELNIKVPFGEFPILGDVDITVTS